jgi:hypothetical protein
VGVLDGPRVRWTGTWAVTDPACANWKVTAKLVAGKSVSFSPVSSTWGLPGSNPTLIDWPAGSEIGCDDPRLVPVDGLAGAEELAGELDADEPDADDASTPPCATSCTDAARSVVTLTS